MDKLCFSCASVDHLNIEDDAYDGHFSQVLTYDDRKRHGYIRNHFTSYELDYDDDFSIYRKETLPISNLPISNTPELSTVPSLWRVQSPHSMRRCNSFLEEDDDSLSREQALQDKFVFPSVDKKMAASPPVSPCPTCTTVSMSDSFDELTDDEEEEISLSSTEEISRLFRQKETQLRTEDEHEAYRYMLRMKPQNYLRSESSECGLTYGGLHNHLRPTSPLPCLPDF